MKKRQATVFKRILVPLLAVVLVQTGILFGSMIFGGAISQLEHNAFDIFSEKIVGREHSLENDMVQRWSRIGDVVETINVKTQIFLEEKGYTYADIASDSEVSGELLMELSNESLLLLRRNSVTGSFIVLEGTEEKKPGLYFYDPNPNSNPSDYSDLLIRRSPSSVSKKLNIAMDSYWQPRFDLPTPSDDCTAFYYEPLEIAKTHPEMETADMGYWSKPFSFSGDAGDIRKSIAYSLPLIGADGTVYGVVGVELSLDYISEQLPVQEMNISAQGGYVLAIKDTQGDNVYEVMAQSGTYLSKMLGKQDHLTLVPHETKEGFYTLANSEHNSPVYIYGEPIQLYNSHAPFSDQQWMLMGICDGDTLLAFSNSFRNLLMISSLIALAIGICGVILSTRQIVQPIGTLAQQLRKADPNEAIVLDKLDITEIDQLSTSIEQLSEQVEKSARRLAEILNMAGVDIGAFEFDKTVPEKVYCTGKLFSLLQMPGMEGKGNFVPTGEFVAFMEHLRKGVEKDACENNSYIFRIEGHPVRWVRLKCVEADNLSTGVMTDVTQEMLERKRIEYDRDYDLLTNVFNRRAFQHHMEQLFAAPQELKIAALIMVDLDNLKYINDTFGHDYGDQYIRHAAQALYRNCGDNGMVFRLSGDEFVVFIYGYDKAEDIRGICENLKKGLDSTFVDLPNHTDMHIRASAGISWYPQDAQNYEDLLKYADFAMYMVKRTSKGDFTDFNIESYNKQAYLLQCNEELNTVIEKELVQYHFQPIVDARTGDVFAYEALMRPQTQNLKDVDKMLQLARSQFKMAHIERLSLFKSMETFKESMLAQSGCKIFINSVANQMMQPDEIEQFIGQFREYLPRMVIELSEEERADLTMTHRKKELLESWGAGFALDDFGKGYSGELDLLDLAPNYVKLDMSLIRNIHVDSDRQHIIKNLISYSKGRNIKIIAEGVEQLPEVEMLISLGVDYLQGYWIARPSSEPMLSYPWVQQHIANIYQKLY